MESAFDERAAADSMDSMDVSKIIKEFGNYNQKINKRLELKNSIYKENGVSKQLKRFSFKMVNVFNDEPLEFETRANWSKEVGLKSSGEGIDPKMALTRLKFRENKGFLPVIVSQKEQKGEEEGELNENQVRETSEENYEEAFIEEGGTDEY